MSIRLLSGSRFLTGLSLILALGIVTVLLTGEGATQGESPCTPGYTKLAEEFFEVQVGGEWHFHLNALLVGCTENLGTLTKDDKDRARMAVTEMVTKFHLVFLGKAEQPEFRSQISEAINQELGAQVVTDIYFDPLGFSESRPPLEGH